MPSLNNIGKEAKSSSSCSLSIAVRVRQAARVMEWISRGIVRMFNYYHQSVIIKD